MVFDYAETFIEVVEATRVVRINQELQLLLKETVVFDEELEGLGIEDSTAGSTRDGTLE